MDPTHDPNFTPPSKNLNMEPPAPSSKIPINVPIQPYVLADLGEALDLPTSHPRSNRIYSISNEQHIEGKYHSKIPRIHTELMSSSSSDDEVVITDDSPYPEPIEEQAGSSSSQKGGQSSGQEILPASIQVKSSQIADLEEVPHGIQRQASELSEYQFPTHRLATTLSDDSKYPLVIVACGSFSPITYLHLRMFEMALDSITEQTRFEVIGGYYSPVSSNYKKAGLAPAHHRVRMCELACERTSSWLMVDAWESLQPRYTRTALVLDHFNEEINVKLGGIKTKSGEMRGVKIMLLAGGDLIESMGEPDVWADLDLHHILGKYGCLIVERTGSDVRSFLLSHDIMYEHRRNVLVIKQLIYNDISSTKIRLFIRRGMSVQYLLPNSVIRYIQQHNLYCDSEPVKSVMSDRAD
ncbi:NMA1 [[Candida] subhashii]|uniref:Nicotinamide-nucleotide adenylyltransferase n=1 Tax=[Candida] subhashii TaxID=561895 RepID=A0A8J5QNH0_9ASCO|nr:NMA1 [[Candida] subhashii]KAG7663217.1 NMA1 [[Candida] subhashii]